jgi:hypothetical protein
VPDFGRRAREGAALGPALFGFVCAAIRAAANTRRKSCLWTKIVYEDLKMQTRNGVPVAQIGRIECVIEDSTIAIVDCSDICRRVDARLREANEHVISKIHAERQSVEKADGQAIIEDTDSGIQDEYYTKTGSGRLC